MDEHYLNKEMSEGEEPPIPIPSVDRAWAGMEQLLNKELPVMHTPAPSSWGLNMKVAALGIIVTIGMSIFLWVGNESTKSVPSAEITKQTNNNTIHSIDTTTNSLQEIFPGAEKSYIDTSKSLSGLFNNQHIIYLRSEKEHIAASESSSASGYLPEVAASDSVGGRVVADREKEHGAVTRLSPANDPEERRATVLRLPSASGDSQKVVTNNREKGSVTASHLSLVNNHAPKVAATNHSKKRVITPKNKQHLPSSAVTDPPLAGAGITPDEHSQTLSATEQGNTTGPQRINLTRVPLGTGKSQGLIHTDMQVSLPEISPKGKPSGLNTWCLWLQLNVPLPLSNTKYYEAGPKGNNAFYRNLIPSVRVEKMIGKSALSIDLRPFSSALLPLHNVQHSNDTLSIAVTQKYMLKQFGPEATLQYHYPVYRNWHISAGIGASWWQKAIIQQTTDTFQLATSIITSSKNDWKNYSRFRLSSTIELYYNTPKWQIGVRTAVPLNKYGNDSVYIRKPLQVEFMLRRRIR